MEPIQVYDLKQIRPQRWSEKSVNTANAIRRIPTIMLAVQPNTTGCGKRSEKSKIEAMDELSYIKENYQEMNDRQLANDLNRSPDAVKKVRLDNNIYRRHRQPWAQPEIKKLAKIYPDASWELLEWTFDRSRNSIIKKATRKNISRSKKKIKEARSKAGSSKRKQKPQVQIVL
jgi:hypothetical protein